MARLIFILATLVVCSATVVSAMIIKRSAVPLAQDKMLRALDSEENSNFQMTECESSGTICQWKVYRPLVYDEFGQREPDYTIKHCDCPVGFRCAFSHYYLQGYYDIYKCRRRSTPATTLVTSPTVTNSTETTNA